MSCSARNTVTSPVTISEESLGSENASLQLKTKSGERFKNGWLAPYIEQNLTKSLKSSEKVELWLRAHFSHPTGQRATGYKQEHVGQAFQYGERSTASESVLTSLAAMVISTLQDTESSAK